MRRGILALVAVLAANAILGGDEARAQTALTGVAISTGVDPDTVTVGDRFRVGIRITAPTGVSVRFPDFDDPSGSVQLAEPARTVQDPADTRTSVHVFPLVAWRTALVNPIVPVELVLADGTTRSVRMELPLPHVRSVLPAAAEAIEPRGHRGIIEAAAPWPLWPFLLLLLLLIALIALSFWLWLRRRRSAPLPIDLENPREWALAELDRTRRELWQNADQRPFFSGVTRAMRGYLAALSQGWSTDLTSGELVRSMLAAGADPARSTELREILDAADRVKFARASLPVDEADAVWRAARMWVEQAEGLGEPAAGGASREAA
jgi:hypothetical protein